VKNIVSTLALIVGVCAGNAFASLISLGPVSLGGQGLGSVQTVLTIQSPGSSSTETGCVASGIGGVLVTGAAACPGGGPFGGPSFSGGNEQAQNNTFSASSLGLTDFNNLRILFNPSEPQNANSISLDNLALTLWNPANGLILDARYITAPVLFTSSDPGAGNAGFGFKLDAAQAAAANGILAAFPNLRIGLAADASLATGGLETFSIGAVTAVPEPGVLGLMLVGLVGLIGFRKQLSR
jgi:hypothetical protein